MLITYTYYHSDIKATPCGFSNVSRSEVVYIDIFLLNF
jgi:hypothetical protein